MDIPIYVIGCMKPPILPPIYWYQYHHVLVRTLALVYTRIYTDDEMYAIYQLLISPHMCSYQCHHLLARTLTYLYTSHPDVHSMGIYDIPVSSYLGTYFALYTRITLRCAWYGNMWYIRISSPHRFNLGIVYIRIPLTKHSFPIRNFKFFLFYIQMK